VRSFRRKLYAALLMVVALMVVLFLLENQQGVSLFIWGWAAPDLPVSALLIMALLLGMALSPLLVCLKGRKGRPG